jgi:CheY-like chemotaxis protein
MPDNEPDIIILLVEDIATVREPWGQWIKERWSEKSRSVASYESALTLLEAGFKPDLVFFDRSILWEDDDDFDDPDAGDALYTKLRARNIPVVVFSGTDLAREEPYFSNKPLKIYSKPYDDRHLIEAVDLFKMNRSQG